MTRRVSVLLLALCLALVTITPAFAMSPTAFTGGASSQSLDLTLDLALAEISLDVGALQATQASDDVNPSTTAGMGEGINLSVLVGDPEIGLDLINVESMHTFGDGPTADTDSDSLTDVDTELLDVGALALDTSSLATADTVNSTLNWDLAGLTLHGDVLGASDLLTTGVITGSATTDTSAEGVFMNTAHSNINGLALEVPLALATLELVTVDAISTTASAGNGGTDGAPSAYANTEFVNLQIQGEDFSTAEPGTVVDLQALGISIGSVTIRPIEEVSVSTTQSSAETVALRITILEVLGLIGANIDIGTTSAQAAIQPSTPTAVTVTSFNLTPGANLPATIGTFVLGGLFLGMVVWARRRTR